MPALRVIIATSSPLAQSRLARDLAALPDIDLCGQATDLSAVYMLAEQREPDIALIGRDMLNHPDFEGILSLFGMIGTACIEIATGPGAAAGDAAILPGTAPAALRARLHAVQAAAMPRRLPAVTPADSGTARAFRPDSVILIGASTGGIDALLQILSALPPDCPPTAIVQHTGAAFSDSLIRLFVRCAKARVLPAQDGIALSRGTIVVGAGCRGHLQLAPGTPLQTRVLPGTAVSGHIPSVDVLFQSALPVAPRIVAALLTGMGRDGAQGLLELRRAGARTLAQDEASSVVYGMPRAAADLGAAEQIVALPQMAGAILAHCTEQRMEAARK